MLKHTILGSITLILALFTSTSFAISPGAGQAQMQNNMQQMQQNKRQLEQMRQNQPTSQQKRRTQNQDGFQDQTEQ